MFEEKFLGWSVAAEVTRRSPWSVEDQGQWPPASRMEGGPGVPGLQQLGGHRSPPPAWSGPGVCHQVILGVGAGVST